MKKVVGFSAIFITLSILLIASILFYHIIDDNIGGFGVMFTFFGVIWTGIILIKEIHKTA